MWAGVGGTPESVVRAARHGLPLMLAIIGGKPSRTLPHPALMKSIALYGTEVVPRVRRLLDQAGYAPPVA